jgi:hypothetical protein
MDASCFATILAGVVARIPGAYAAVLVDREGETVDYTGDGNPYDLTLAAAHWQIVLRECADFTAAAHFGASRSIAVRGATRSFIVHALPEGYALIVLLGRRAGFSPIHRAFSICERALADEARWDLPKPPPNALVTSWFPVDVTLGRTKRPARVSPATAPFASKSAEIAAIPTKSASPAVTPAVPLGVEVEVLGSMRGVGIARELGYRVRTPSGLEFTLVREPGGFWYSDENVTNA